MATLTVELYNARTRPPQHVLKAAVTLHVTATDGTEVALAPTGLATKTFDDVPADDGTELNLVIEIGRPTPAKGKSDQRPLLTVQQQSVVRAGALVHVWSNDSDGSQLHARVSETLAGKDQLGKLSVDLTFLDVTQVIRQQTQNLATYDRPHPDFNNDAGEQSPRDMHHGCELHVYEFSDGDPKAWCVVVPPAARERWASDVSFLVYYRPSYPDANYTSAVNTTYPGNRLNRQTRDPPKWGPFFARAHGSPHADKEEYAFDFESEEDAPADSPRSWYAFSFTGFEGQLAASQRPVILVIPLPRTLSFGVASMKDLESRLRSLAVALHGDDVLHRLSPSERRLLRRRSDGDVPIKLPDSRDTAPSSVGRVALAGYSAGGDGMISGFAANPRTVSELYWFDPSFIADAKSTVWTQKTRKALIEWLKDDKSRRIVVLAGSFHTVLDTLVSELRMTDGIEPTQIDLTPETTAIFEEVNGIYHASMTPPGSPEEMLSVAGQPIDALSRRTGVFLLKADDMMSKPALCDEKGNKLSQPGCSAVEASGGLAFLLPASPNDKPDDPVAKFNYTLVAKLGESSFFATIGLRHQWVVSGGQGAKARFPYGELPEKPDGPPQVFEGYLSYCLKRSGFVKK